MDKAVLEALKEIKRDLDEAFITSYTQSKQTLISQSIGRVETLITFVKEESK